MLRAYQGGSYISCLPEVHSLSLWERVRVRDSLRPSICHMAWSNSRAIKQGTRSTRHFAASSAESWRFGLRSSSENTQCHRKQERVMGLGPTTYTLATCRSTN